MFYLLANSDLDAVPSDVVKYVLMVLGWLATTGAAIYGGSRWGKIKQPFEVAKHDQAARKSELDKLEESIKKFGERVESLAEQMNSQFTAMKTAGENRAAAITQSIDEDLAVLMGKIESFMLMATRHDAVLPQVEARLHELAKEQHEASQRLHARIDDAMRLNATKPL